MSRLGCIVLRSHMHGDTYAYRLARSVDRENPESLIAFARDFASTLPWDDGETLRVGYVTTTDDPGAARLVPDPIWIGTITPD